MALKRLLFLLSLLLMAMILATGCKRTAPVQDVVDSPLWAEKGQSLAKAKKAIMAACAEQGWIIQDDKGNRIRAKLMQRSHEAVVDIPYTADKYSILYVSSANLAYENGKIHTKYNNWVRNLSKAIELEMARNR